MKMQTTLFGLLLLASCSVAIQERKYIVAPRLLYTKDLPFSNAVVVGDTLYLAGRIGLDPNTGQRPQKPKTKLA